MIHKAFSPPPKAACSLVFGALLLLLFIVNPANSAFQCTICPENFYCNGGQKLACPENTVTNGTMAKSEDECISCATKNYSYPVYDNGACISCYQSSKDSDNITHTWKDNACVTCATASENTPVFKDEANGCVSCETEDATKPYWNGINCVGCIENEEWNPESKTCGCKGGFYKEFEIYKPDGTVAFYLSEDMISKIGSSVSKDECEEMNADDTKYPEISACYVAHDCWATAVKYCSEQGKRLPTAEELAYLAQNIYGDTTIGNSWQSDNLTVKNKELFALIMKYPDDGGETSFWTSREYTGTDQPAGIYSYIRAFSETTTWEHWGFSGRGNCNHETLCVPK